MTGEKNKFTTHEKLWNLDDKSLSTPKHDEMVLYLLNKSNVIQTIPELKPFCDSEEIKMAVYGRSDILGEGRMCTNFRHLLLESEKPIIGHNKFIIGYWDIMISFRFRCQMEESLSYLNKLAVTPYEAYVHSHSRNESIPTTYFPIYIEVKPTIKSFGETLRQLKTYQAYVPESIGRTYLFTSDMGFKGAFESQGIHVIEYKV